MASLLALGAAALIAVTGPTASLEIDAAQAPLADSELAEMRGGFILPNGIEIGLALQTSAMADHQLILTSNVNVAQSGDISITARKDAGAPNEATLQVDQQGVRYVAPGFAITQRVGESIGTVVENSSDNRTLFISSLLTVTLGNVDPGSMGGAGAAIGRLTSDLAAVRQ
ncbi:hypothetical protein BH10PSE13_BH10PSE13_04350 [soil metagenome]